MSSYTEKISDKINSFNSHKVFFANDFLDIASNATVRQILKRLADEDKMLEDFEEDDEDYISESEDESDNEESHEESLYEDDEDELL